MKIMIKKEDYVRLYIISKKINEQNLNDDEIADIKINYYSYLTIYHNHHSNYLEASRCYRIIWNTLITTKKMIPEMSEFGYSLDPLCALSNYVGFLVLHPWSPDTEAELQTLHDDEKIEKNESVYHMITNFLSKEIVPTEFATYRLDEFELFRETYHNGQVH